MYGYGRRNYLGFGLFGLGAAIALAASHLGHDVFTPVALVVAAIGAVPLFACELFRFMAERLPVHFGSAALYGALARRLTARAGLVLHLISASISAASVGILAMLPIGARLDRRGFRVGLTMA